MEKNRAVVLTGLGSNLSPPLCGLGSDWPSLGRSLAWKAKVTITSLRGGVQVWPHSLQRGWPIVRRCDAVSSLSLVSPGTQIWGGRHVAEPAVGIRAKRANRTGVCPRGLPLPSQGQLLALVLCRRLQFGISLPRKCCNLKWASEELALRCLPAVPA